MVTKLVLFVGASVVLGHVSKTSLSHPRSHGFYRFLAWEFILALVLVNVLDLAQWFGDPFCLRQLASWVLLVGSIVPVTWGAHLLRTRGRPRATRDDRHLWAFEKTLLFAAEGGGCVVLHDARTGALLCRQPSGIGTLWVAAFSPDGRYVCGGDDLRHLQLLALEGLEHRPPGRSSSS